MTGENETFGCCGTNLYYGRMFGHDSLNFNDTQGGVWLHSLTGANETHRYWEFMWSYQ
jgi:hypothetical protein